MYKYMVMMLIFSHVMMHGMNNDEISQKRRLLMEQARYAGLTSEARKGLCKMTALGLSAAIGVGTIATSLATMCVANENEIGRGYTCESPALQLSLEVLHVCSYCLLVEGAFGVGLVCTDCCLEKNPCFRQCCYDPKIFCLSKWQVLKEKIMGRHHE